MRVIVSFIYNVIIFVIMCASNTRYDWCLSCSYRIMSLFSSISCHISILSWPSNIPYVLYTFF